MAELAQLEARLAIALRTRAELEAQLTQPEVLADHTALARIGRELSRTAPLAEAAATLPFENSFARCPCRKQFSQINMLI